MFYGRVLLVIAKPLSISGERLFGFTLEAYIQFAKKFESRGNVIMTIIKTKKFTDRLFEECTTNLGEKS